VPSVDAQHWSGRWEGQLWRLIRILQLTMLDTIMQ